METVLDYRIPVLHPFAVHLPVTLLLTAAIAALIWMFRGTAFWRRCCLFLLLLSTPAAAFAYFTGDEMQERAEGVPIVDELVGLHERMALITLLFTATVTLLFGVYHFRIGRVGRQVDSAERRVDQIENKVEPIESKVEPGREASKPPDERHMDPIGSRVAVSILVFLAAALVAWTAHIGATMTWGVAR